MIKVEIYSKKDCPLCDEAKGVLARVRERVPFELLEIDIEGDPALFERFKDDVPVVFVDGSKAFKHHLNERDVEARLGRVESVHPERSRGGDGVGRATKVGFLVAVLLALGAVCGIEWYERAVVAPREELASLEVESLHFPAPAFKLADAEGHPRSLADYRGKFVLLNFWATWCPPCRAEIPSMSRLAEELDDEPNFALVALSVDDDWAAVKGFFHGRVPGFQILLDQGARVSEAYGTSKFPESYVVDPSGQVIAKFTGPRDWSDPAAVNYFRRLLD
jgi:thiol-disulfide isomerase/thioredoxin